MSSIFFLIGIGFFVGTAAWFLFIWAVKSGQFDDPEAPKYRMLDDDDEESPVERKGDKRQ
ncbi:MAG: cbb3-type cytochrome oxidase assembly protein CcoS [Chlorobiaceae bacterium]|nr:cbb3-type cytochrome oxidase assembly protein CcoS [Chlorobiaceae bacterium]